MDNKNTVVLVNNELRHDYVLQLPRESSCAPPTSVHFSVVTSEPG